MVMQRALFTWFILLLFFVLLCLRLDGRIHWNWFLIFLPMWLYDLLLTINALYHIVMDCKQDSFKELCKNKNNVLLLVIILKITAQIMICLKLEYRSLNIALYYVLLPFWLLLPILIIDISWTLFFKRSYSM